MGKTLHALLWSVLFGFATTATATVISFSYTGFPNCAPHSCTDELTGSFAFADGLLFVDRANLSAFSLTDTFTYTDVPIAFNVTRSLADLQSFAATLDAAQNLLSLTFKTDNFNDQVGGVVFTSTAIPNVEVVHCSLQKRRTDRRSTAARSVLVRSSRRPRCRNRPSFRCSLSGWGWPALATWASDTNI